MTRLVVRMLALALPLAPPLTTALGTPVSAHEPRSTGRFAFVVGWGDEPAFTGFKNSVQVTITEANGGGPVTDITDSLSVEVIKGDDKVTLPLTPHFRVGAFGTPGDYRAWLTPTRPGSYTFRVFGTIRGQALNESFTSSRTTFNDVEDVVNSEFPAKDPSTGQLATRIDREVPRLEAALADAEDDASRARALALAGLGVGTLGLLVAAVALVGARGRKDGTTPAPIPRTESLRR